MRQVWKAREAEKAQQKGKQADLLILEQSLEESVCSEKGNKQMADSV